MDVESVSVDDVVTPEDISVEDVSAAEEMARLSPENFTCESCQ